MGGHIVGKMSIPTHRTLTEYRLQRSLRGTDFQAKDIDAAQ